MDRIIGDGHRVASKQNNINKPTVQNINVIYDIIHEFIVFFHDLTKSKVCESVQNLVVQIQFSQRFFGRKIDWFYFWLP